MRIGIDLGGTKIEGLVLGPGGQELARGRAETPPGDYEATVAAIAALVAELVQEAPGEAVRPGVSPKNKNKAPGIQGGLTGTKKESGAGGDVPVGVGIPGAIAPKTGLIKNANSTCLIGQALDKDLEAATGRRVRLANDADCFAISEATDGAGQEARKAAGLTGTKNFTVFGVILGTGWGNFSCSIDESPRRINQNSTKLFPIQVFHDLI